VAKGFGIAAIICAVLAIFVPFVGIAISGIAIVLAVIAASFGDKPFATATSLVAAINTFFLSPSITLFLKTFPSGSVVGVFLFVCAVAPIAVVIGMTLYEQRTRAADGGRATFSAREEASPSRSERTPDVAASVERDSAQRQRSSQRNADRTAVRPNDYGQYNQSPRTQGQAQPWANSSVGRSPVASAETQDRLRPGSESEARSVPSYDLRKWRALIRFDDDIAAAAKQARGYGARWEDELARSYLLLNDKGYLAAILDKVTKDARAQSI
jgi:hypothetical protein